MLSGMSSVPQSSLNMVGTNDEDDTMPGPHTETRPGLMPFKNASRCCKVTANTALCLLSINNCVMFTVNKQQLVVVQKLQMKRFLSEKEHATHSE